MDINFVVELKLEDDDEDDDILVEQIELVLKPLINKKGIN